jgi:peroxiredoxin
VTNARPTSESLAAAWREAADANVSLAERLDMYRDASSRLRPDFAQAYDELVDRLGVLERGEVGPQVGERLAEFSLPDQHGRLLSLSSLLQAGPAVISINRGHWCPYCRLELRSLAAVHRSVAEAGASIVSITPDTAEFTSAYSAAQELPFPLLTDVDLGYSLSLGLIFWIGADVGRLYRDAGIDLGRYHRGSGQFLPVAAKFIVGKDGLVKARHVDIEFRRRMEPDAIVTALRALRAA